MFPALDGWPQSNPMIWRRQHAADSNQAKREVTEARSLVSPTTAEGNARERAVIDFARSKDHISMQGEPWSADLAYYATAHAGGTEDALAHEICNGASVFEWAIENQRLTQTPRPGELAVFSWNNGPDLGPDSERAVDSIGVVTDVGAKGIRTIEGNVVDGGSDTGAVRAQYHRFADNEILGYVDVSPYPDAR
jgi:hypothetical protein